MLAFLGNVGCAGRSLRGHQTYVVKQLSFFTAQCGATRATTAQVRIAAIDFAHWQFANPVLIQADRSIKHTQSGKTPQVTTFADLGVRQALIDVLQARGISEPFPIQTQTASRHARRT